MSGVLLDTNAYGALLGGDEAVLDAISSTATVWMSVFVLGELHAGFRGGNRTTENLSLLDRFLRKPTVRMLDATEETARIFGELKDTLKRAGTPLPINDVWIASHCVETGSVLITYDTHFLRIPGLRVWRR